MLWQQQLVGFLPPLLSRLGLLSAAHAALSALAYAVEVGPLPLSSGAARTAALLPIAAVLFALPVLTIDGREEPLLAQSLCCIMSMSGFKVRFT